MLSPRADPDRTSGAGSSPQHGLPLHAERADATLNRLQLVITRRLDGLLQGDYLGLLPGPGSEAGESREYRPGDDVRRMDWPVTARTTVAHVRRTIADRELETWLAVDLSASLDFGSVGSLKRDLAIAAAASVAHLTVRGGNRIGAVVGDGRSVVRLPARSGRRTIRRTAKATVRPTERSIPAGARSTSAGPATSAMICPPLFARTRSTRSRRSTTFSTIPGRPGRRDGSPSRGRTSSSSITTDARATWCMRNPCISAPGTDTIYFKWYEAC